MNSRWGQLSARWRDHTQTFISGGQVRRKSAPTTIYHVAHRPTFDVCKFRKTTETRPAAVGVQPKGGFEQMSRHLNRTYGREMTAGPEMANDESDEVWVRYSSTVICFIRSIGIWFLFSQPHRLVTDLGVARKSVLRKCRGCKAHCAVELSTWRRLGNGVIWRDRQLADESNLKK